MVYRNIKGQILIEALFLMVFFGSLFLMFQGLIDHHRIEMKKVKLNHELQRSFKNENNPNQPTK